MNTFGTEKLGIINARAVYRNLAPARLAEMAYERGEGKFDKNGAFVVLTGRYTGRSPKDKFIVDSPGVHDEISWGKVNVPISQERADAIYEKTVAYFQNKDVFVFDGFAGADPTRAKGFRVVNELASQALFTNQLLIRPTARQLENFVPDFNVIVAPRFKCIPERDGVNSEAAIVIDYEKRTVVIAGSQYAGEIKKSIFSVMNYLMPKEGVFPMHCSANVGDDGESALFFGLSGTGKTTLSADPNRRLIGDDEHGWSDGSVFNFEGGCYAKCIRLSREREPQIWDAVRFGSLVENVVMDDETRTLDFDDAKYTENSRVGYPIEYIPNAISPGIGKPPKTVVFLTADAYGVLPPISKLNRNQAMYYFVSGFTSKLAGTERGIDEPVPTFSTCFGAPFLPLDPSLYADMLKEKILKNDSNVYLVNTGWCGGKAGTIDRIKLRYTRAMVTAALNGSLEKGEFETDPHFGVSVPTKAEGVPEELLIPGRVWKDREEYAKTANELAGLFIENFKRYANMPQCVIDAGPKRIVE